jgi:hypothetical protein
MTNKYEGYNIEVRYDHVSYGVLPETISPQDAKTFCDGILDQAESAALTVLLNLVQDSPSPEADQVMLDVFSRLKNKEFGFRVVADNASQPETIVTALQNFPDRTEETRIYAMEALCKSEKFATGKLYFMDVLKLAKPQDDLLIKFAELNNNCQNILDSFRSLPNKTKEMAINAIDVISWSTDGSSNNDSKGKIIFEICDLCPEESVLLVARVMLSLEPETSRLRFDEKYPHIRAILDARSGRTSL